MENDKWEKLSLPAMAGMRFWDANRVADLNRGDDLLVLARAGVFHAGALSDERCYGFEYRTHLDRTPR